MVVTQHLDRDWLKVVAKKLLRYITIESNKLINVNNIIYNNLGCEISDSLPQLHSISGTDTMLYVICRKVYVFTKVCEDPSSITLIKMLSS